MGRGGTGLFQHTFNNATPTFGGQLPTVSAVPGQSSEPIVLGGFDADGDPLSYSISGAGSGSGSAGGVLAITDGSAVYTPPGAWDGTTSYDDEFWSPSPTSDPAGMCTVWRVC